MTDMNMWYSFFIFLTSWLSSPETIDSLKKTADRSFIGLLIVTAIVAIGVLFEGPEIWRELKKWRKAKGRKRSCIPVASAIGFVIVALAVFGEGVFEASLGIADTQIREIDEKTAQTAGDNADKAVKDLGIAQIKLGEVSDEAEDIKRKAAQLRTNLTAATKKVDATTERLDEAQKRLTESEAQLRTNIDLDELRLAAAQSGHTFWYRLFSSLRGQRPAQAGIVCLRGTTLESRLFADKLSVALHDFGWIS